MRHFDNRAYFVAGAGVCRRPGVDAPVKRAAVHCGNILKTSSQMAAEARVVGAPCNQPASASSRLSPRREGGVGAANIETSPRHYILKDLIYCSSQYYISPHSSVNTITLVSYIMRTRLLYLFIVRHLQAIKVIINEMGYRHDASWLGPFYLHVFVFLFFIVPCFSRHSRETASPARRVTRGARQYR